MLKRFIMLCFALCGLGALALAAAPTISTITPSSGPIGVKVTLHGSGYTGATAVYFACRNPNGVSQTVTASFTVVSASYITAIVPSGATTGVITVIVPNSKVTSATSFTVVPAPTISSFLPSNVAIGQKVALTGTSFTGATAVKFNGTAAASFTVVSATSITAIVASGTASGVITVTTPGGTATSATKFTVIPAPTIISISPTSGLVGGKITLHGSNFTGATAVYFNAMSTTGGSAPGVTNELLAATFTIVSASYITAIVPKGAATGPIIVVTPGGSVTSVTSYIVNPAVN